MRIEQNAPVVQNITNVRNPEPAPVVQSVKAEKVERASSSYAEFSHKSELELTIDEKNWMALIERANKAITGANKTFEYSIHEQTKQIMVKVIDSDTNKVIIEIPPEKVLDMVAKMWEMAGILVDERR
jgi:flagellar protein FlaG